jgi:hypothetical protein
VNFLTSLRSVPSNQIRDHFFRVARFAGAILELAFYMVNCRE